MKKSEATFSFICHMTKITNSVEPKIRINFIPVGQGKKRPLLILLCTCFSNLYYSSR